MDFLVVILGVFLFICFVIIWNQDTTINKLRDQNTLLRRELIQIKDNIVKIYRENINK